MRSFSRARDVLFLCYVMFFQDFINADVARLYTGTHSSVCVVERLTLLRAGILIAMRDQAVLGGLRLLWLWLLLCRYCGNLVCFICSVYCNHVVQKEKNSTGTELILPWIANAVKPTPTVLDYPR